jgi:hypothetical protein
VLIGTGDDDKRDARAKGYGKCVDEAESDADADVEDVRGFGRDIPTPSFPDYGGPHSGALAQSNARFLR